MKINEGFPHWETKIDTDMMDKVREYFVNASDYFLTYAKTMTINDLIDIFIVSILFYYAFRFIRNRRAGRLASGVVVLIILQVISNRFELNTIGFLLQNIFQVGIIALIIIFQPEIRSALEKMGAEPLRSLKMMGDQTGLEETKRVIIEICEAACDLSKDKTGALIVVERKTKLGDYTKGRTILDAEVTSQLLRNIFFKFAPLHDGAVIISNNRVLAAGCYLPLSTNEDITRNLGTRHRAAVGMSENSDAVVVVVSEETGAISVAHDGRLIQNLDYRSLDAVLSELIATEKHLKSRKNQNNKKTKQKTEK